MKKKVKVTVSYNECFDFMIRLNNAGYGLCEKCNNLFRKKLVEEMNKK